MTRRMSSGKRDEDRPLSNASDIEPIIKSDFCEWVKPRLPGSSGYPLVAYASDLGQGRGGHVRHGPPSTVKRMKMSDRLTMIAML